MKMKKPIIITLVAGLLLFLSYQLKPGFLDEWFVKTLRIVLLTAFSCYIIALLAIFLRKTFPGLIRRIGDFVFGFIRAKIAFKDELRRNRRR